LGFSGSTLPSGNQSYGTVRPGRSVEQESQTASKIRTPIVQASRRSTPLYYFPLMVYEWRKEGKRKVPMWVYAGRAQGNDPEFQYEIEFPPELFLVMCVLALTALEAAA
jgi:hypothetical protein